MVTYLIAKFWTITISYIFKNLFIKIMLFVVKKKLHVLPGTCCKTFHLVTCILNLVVQVNLGHSHNDKKKQVCVCVCVCVFAC